VIVTLSQTHTHCKTMLGIFRGTFVNADFFSYKIAICK
jgi:hypothetical protein